MLIAGLTAKGAEPVASPAVLPETGATDPRLAGFDRVMAQFVRQRKIPGAALAVAKAGRLVYARGFGHADVENRIPIEPDALFRIASLSKPITAVAVMQLVEQSRLRLIDKVASVLKVEPYLSDTARFDERLRDVTILQLLQHRGGWDRELSPDPMFLSIKIARTLLKPPPAEAEDIIRYTFGRRLDFDPGSRYAYSNFDYCLLGRVIEKVTGDTYEHYVQEHVLGPLGITRMQIGRTLPSERAEGEVCYYTADGATGASVLRDEVGAPVPRPYGCWSLEAMDSNGGWIASAVDLVRFASTFDEPARSPLLKPETMALACMRPTGRAGYDAEGAPKESYYGCGWHVRPVGKSASKVDLSHSGSLDGTSALLAHRHDGVAWAVLFNTGASSRQKPFDKAIEPLLHEVADEVSQWPELDLFRSADHSPRVVSERMPRRLPLRDRQR